MMTFAFILTATPYQVYAATGSIEIPIISHSVSAGYNYSQGKTSGRFSLAGAKYVSFSFYSFASKAQATLYGVRANGTVNTLFTYDCPTTNGSTSATYTFTDADLETYEEFYVYAFGHCNYGDAEARPAASAQISATLYKSASPVITSNLTDIDTIEGKDAICQIVATFPSGSGSYQWQKCVSVEGVDVWVNCDDGAAYSGTTTGIMTVKSPTLADDGTRFRCICYSGTEGVADTISNEGRLNVAPKNYESIQVKTTTSQLNIGSTLKTSDLFIILKYDNGEYYFITDVSNFDLYFVDDYGLSTETTSTEKTINIGENVFTVLLDSETHPCTDTLTIQGADLQPPVITNFNAESTTFINESDYIDVSNPSNPSEITLNVAATDNCSTNTLYYRWLKNGSEMANVSENTVAVSIDKANHSADGKYTCEVRDGVASQNVTSTETAEITHKQIIIDTTPPEITYDYNLYGVNPYVVITMNAEDNIGTLGMRYKFKECTDADKPNSENDDDVISWMDDGNWGVYPVMTIAKNATYYMAARDIAGNIAYEKIDVVCIPNEAPTIENIQYESTEGGNFLIVSATSYDKEDSTLRYYLDGMLFNDNHIPMVNADVNAEHTLMVKDVKDSSADITFTLSGLMNYITDGSNNLASVSKSPLTWTNNTGVTLTANIIDTANVVTDKAVAFVDITESERNVEEKDYVSASGSASYSYVARYKNGQNYEIPLKYRVFVRTANNVYHTDIVINNIDAIKPTYTTPVFDGFNKITFKAQDSQSGLYSIQYNLNTDDNETTSCIYKQGVKSEQDVEIIITKAGTYRFSITDNTGNKTENTADLQVVIPFVKINNPNLDYTNNTLKDVVITQNPTTWTNKSVTCSVNMSSLGIAAYSWDDGVSWGNSTSIVLDENRTVNFMAKDAMGNVFTGPTLKVENIDKVAPTISETGSGTSYKATCADDGSGIKSITVNGVSYSSAKTTTFSEETKQADVIIDATENGTYSITVVDNAGNTYGKSMYINNVTATDKTVSTKTVYKEIPVEKIVTKTKVITEEAKEPEEILITPIAQNDTMTTTAVKTERNTTSDDIGATEINYPTDTIYGSKVPGVIHNPIDIDDGQIPLVNRLVELAVSPVGLIIIVILLIVIGTLIIMYYKKSHRVYKYKQQDRDDM